MDKNSCNQTFYCLDTEIHKTGHRSVYYVLCDKTCRMWPTTSCFPQIFHHQQENTKHQFNSVPWPIQSLRGHEGRFSREILFQSFLQEALVSSSGIGREVHSLILSIQTFPLLTMALPGPPRCPEGWFCKLSRCVCQGCCQKRFLWTNKEVDLALHPVVGLVLQVEDEGKFPHELGFKSLDPFSELASKDHVPQPLKRLAMTCDL